ncbi:hypothetical protein, conserved in T. vivax [Trypanosoma vivax Y486]|uniref:Uncharacterized protein n=1 Tax=Trypanosoma vivax (strain Y486) TaxID=1055687 RepID=F9WKM5_TRYVY|nr:hypothetical protein, conserved in T. vivax [Trypanosoma vivax Y486]|eukprot:CCD18047.1 hypothetical protein, conserved in T. vivax [Trypanosoma vivax Y486]
MKARCQNRRGKDKRRGKKPQSKHTHRKNGKGPPQEHCMRTARLNTAARGGSKENKAHRGARCMPAQKGHTRPHTKLTVQLFLRKETQLRATRTEHTPVQKQGGGKVGNTDHQQRAATCSAKNKSTPRHAPHNRRGETRIGGTDSRNAQRGRGKHQRANASRRDAKANTG